MSSYAQMMDAKRFEGEVRSGFVCKVYGILSAQMALTVAICATMMFTPCLQKLAVSYLELGPWNMLISFVPSIMVLCCLMYKRKEYPQNYILLTVFTVVMAFPIGVTCALFQLAGQGILILEAFVLTAVVFLSLTAYALISKANFSYLGGFLSAGLTCMILVGFAGMFFPGLTNNILYPICGVLLFTGYILFDTWRIESQLDPDEYITGAIDLYLDILNLFLYILQILGSSRD